MLYNLNICVEDLAQTYPGSMIVALVSMSLYEPGLGDSVLCVFVMSSTHLVPTVFPPLLL